MVIGNYYCSVYSNSKRSHLLHDRPVDNLIEVMDSKMMVIFSVLFFAGIAYAAPAPKADAAFVTPVVAAAPAVVTATSSQVIARNYNGIAAPLVAAPAVAAPLAAAPVVAAPYAAPYAAYSAYPAYASPYFAYY